MKEKGTRIFDLANTVMLFALAIVTIYPFIYVLSVSLSDPAQVAAGRVGIIPRGITLETYERVLDNPHFLRGYLNTIFYVVSGTSLSLLLTLFTAYPLSRQRLTGKTFFTVFITFPMMFGGGMIPTYLVVKSLGMINTIWAVIIPGVIGPWTIIISRTFLKSIPDSLEQYAALEGANDLQILFKIFMPLSKPLIAVLILFHAVGVWNSFFGPFIYLNEKSKWPLQLFLRQIVIAGEFKENMTYVDDKAMPVALAIKMTTISVTIIPIICVYPFLQKYFVKGVMIGALKG